jgi:hypothetical protein
MTTQAEREYLRAKARLKLERQREREAERERRAVEHPHGGKVAAAMIIFGLMMMVIGVTILMRNNPWKSGPAPLTPIPSTTTITFTPPPTCILTLQMRGCRWPDGPCPRVGPCVTMTPPPPITDLPGLPGSSQWCAQYPNDRENCGPTTTPTTPPTTAPPRGGPGECDPYRDECNQRAPTTPTTSPFPTQLLCDAIKPTPPNCPVESPVPTVPGVPGSRQGQVI